MKTDQDPIMSPRAMARDAGISMATWVRNYRYHPKLKIIRLSPHRIGARRSNWREVVDQQTESSEAA